MMPKSNLFAHHEFQRYETNGNQIIIHTSRSPKIRLDVCFSDTIRVWADQKGEFSKKRSYAVEEEDWNLIDFEIEDWITYIRIVTSHLSVRVYKNPLRIEFYQPDNSTLITGERETGGMGWDEDGSVFMYNQLAKDEHFYGLGEDNEAYLGNLDRRGTSRDMITGQKISEGSVTADIPVTFFMSTNESGHGYGMFVDNTYRMEFNMGKESDDYYFWKAEGGELLYYFMNGPSFSSIINRYTLLTGRPSMTPLWVLGYIQSKCTFYNWDEIDDVIQTLREKQFPMDVMVIDADWPEHMVNFEWHSRWKGMSEERIARYRAEGVKFMISTSGPMIKKDSSNYKDGVQNGIFATDGEGNTLTCGWYGGELMDYTAPNIKEWMWPQLKPLYDAGVRAWWLDLTEPEGEPLQTVYQGGPRAEIHNIYSMLNTKAYYEMTKAYAPNSRPFILTRTGTAGIQKYGAAVWTGDVYCDYATFAAHCPEALNSTMSGITAWTSDSGGFISSTYRNEDGHHIHLYKNDVTSQALLYERWMQFSCFTPITRAHHVGPSTPFNFGELVEAGCRHYLQLRYRLLPYIYSYAWETHKTGSSIMRALVFEYQKDPKVMNIKDQYLFGRELMVAPVLTENTTARTVYFPEGTWIDYDYGYEYEGGKEYTVYAPQNRIPVFVKKGSIIPMAQPMLYTDEKSWDPITFDIYPAESSSFKMYCDDGETMEFEEDLSYTETEIRCESFADKQLSIDVTESNKRFVPSQYAFAVHLNQLPTEVSAMGNPLDQLPSHSRFKEAGQGWWWDKNSFTLHIKIVNDPGLKSYVTVMLDANKLYRMAPPEIQFVPSELTASASKPSQIPYLYPASMIPCRIQAENFDRGGEGIAYHMETSGNQGGQYRDEDVNIELSTDHGGGYNVVGLEADEWLEYSVNVKQQGRYDLEIRAAAQTEDCSLHLELNQTDLTGIMDVPNEEERQPWHTLKLKNILLKAGEQVLKVQIDSGKIDINYIDFL